MHFIAIIVELWYNYSIISIIGGVIMKDIINIISEICSILGFIISLFIASKLIKNSNSNNENEGEIFQGGR